MGKITFGWESRRLAEDAEKEQELEYLSTCCIAPRWNDTDICSRCKEHATFEDEDGNEEE